MNVEFPQMYNVLMLIFIYIKDMLLLCYPASLIQRNATCSYLKGTGILFQFIFLMQKSILYAKIAISQEKFQIQ